MERRKNGKIMNSAGVAMAFIGPIWMRTYPSKTFWKDVVPRKVSNHSRAGWNDDEISRSEKNAGQRKHHSF